MPITVIAKRVNPLTTLIAGATTTYTTKGTQTVSNTLTLANPTIVEFDASIFTQYARYRIFNFNALALDGTTAVDAATAASYLQADATSLAECGFTLAAFQVTYTDAEGGPGYIDAIVGP